MATSNLRKMIDSMAAEIEGSIPKEVKERKTFRHIKHASIYRNTNPVIFSTPEGIAELNNHYVDERVRHMHY